MTQTAALPKSMSKRQVLEGLRAQLDNERQSFIPHWRDLSDYLLPRRSRFYTADVNRGDRRNLKILDNTGGLALRTLRSGMMGGITSPARPWFRLTTPDPELAEYGPVKEWLDYVTRRMTTYFLRSNLYNALPIVYGDMGCFGTAAMVIEEDFNTLMRAYPLPIGSYMIANNQQLKVDMFMREFRYTVRQLVEKFAKRDPKTGAPDMSNFSTYVQNAWDKGQYEIWVDVVHVIRPNPNWNDKMLAAKFKRYESCYYERGQASNSKTNYMTKGDEQRYLSESGYDLFPVLAPRWEVTGEDVYGTSCPGMEALGDVRGLQLMNKRLDQAVELLVKPPTTGPTALKQAKVSILPGDITYSDEREGQKGFRTAYEINPRIAELTNRIGDTRNVIRRAFYEDLFLMLSNDERLERPTAREIDERHEEKLLALGPMLEQTNQDMLDPLIDINFAYMVRQGEVPPAPEELQGTNLKVEYVSVMAQAQKMVGISGIERFTNFVGTIAERTGNPAVMDKVDTDNLIDEYGDRMGVPARVVRSDEKVEEIRGARAKQQATLQQAEVLKAGTDAARNLAAADMSGDNALTRITKDLKKRGRKPAEVAA